MAFPHGVVENNATLAERIAELITNEGIAEVVIGESRALSGAANPLQEQIQNFIGELTFAVPVPIHLHDERFTTKEAERIQGTNKLTDASAAAILLNDYLTQHIKKS